MEPKDNQAPDLPLKYPASIAHDKAYEYCLCTYCTLFANKNKMP